jgi:hypothetical protein
MYSEWFSNDLIYICGISNEDLSGEITASQDKKYANDGGIC